MIKRTRKTKKQRRKTPGTRPVGRPSVGPRTMIKIFRDPTMARDFKELARLRRESVFCARADAPSVGRGHFAR